MLKEFCEKNKEAVLNIIRDLCRIPAPSHMERRRAEYCRDWLIANGAEGVYLDEVDNVIFPLGCEGSNEITMVAAHTDTVFPDTESYPEFHEDDVNIYCPGVGDDTTSVAILLLTAKYFIDNKITPKGGILFVCNVCEEGLGDLKGVKQLMKDFAGRPMPSQTMVRGIQETGGMGRMISKMGRMKASKPRYQPMNQPRGMPMTIARPKPHRAI